MIYFFFLELITDSSLLNIFYKTLCKLKRSNSILATTKCMVKLTMGVRHKFIYAGKTDNSMLPRFS